MAEKSVKIGPDTNDFDIQSVVPMFSNYSVKSGDTLSKIASFNNISIDDLVKYNPEIENINSIQIGQNIRIPSIPSMVSREPEFVEYEVKKGDTLSSIASKNNIPLREVLKLNKDIKNINLLSVGQKINLPVIDERNPVLYNYRELRKKENSINSTGDNEHIIKSANHKENYIIVDKKKRSISVYDKNNNLLYNTKNIDTGKSGDDYNTITYVDSNGNLINHKGNNSTPAGITKITGVSSYHGKPSFVRSRYNVNSGKWDDEIASSMHFSSSANGSNGCVRLLGNTPFELSEYVGEGTMVYTLPEREGSRFVLKEGDLNFIADNPYGEVAGSKKYWDDYNVHIDKTYKPLNISLENSDISKNEAGIIGTLLDLYKGSVSDLRRENMEQYASGISDNKEILMKEFGVSSSVYNDIAEVALGVAGQESDFGTSYRYILKNMISDELLDFVKKKTRGKVSYRSRGITQTKIKGDNKETRELYNKYNINEDTLEDPKMAGLGAMIRLLGMYKNEVLGRNFTDINGNEMQPTDILYYKWFGGNDRLQKGIANPEDNEYIKNAKKYSGFFNMTTKFKDGGKKEESKYNILKSVNDFAKRTLFIPSLVFDRIYSDVTGKPTDYNKALYASIDPTGQRPDFSINGVAEAIANTYKFLKKYYDRDFENIDYIKDTENIPLQNRVAIAAWAKYNKLPYDESLIIDNGDGTYSLPKEIEKSMRKDRSDIEKVYNINKKNYDKRRGDYEKRLDIARSNNDMSDYNKVRNEMEQDDELFYLKTAVNMDKKNLEAMDSLMAGKPSVFNEFNYKNRNIRNIEENKGKLNVLGNHTLYKRDDGRVGYRDIYDLNQPFDFLLGGAPFYIRGVAGGASSGSKKTKRTGGEVSDSEKDKNKRWWEDNEERRKIIAKQDSAYEARHNSPEYVEPVLGDSSIRSDVSRDEREKIRYVQNSLFDEIFKRSDFASGYKNAQENQIEEVKDKYYPIKLGADAVATAAELYGAGYTLMSGAKRLGLLNNAMSGFVSDSDRAQMIGSLLGTGADMYQLMTADDNYDVVSNTLGTLGGAAGFIGGTNLLRNSAIYGRYGDKIDKALDFVGYTTAGSDLVSYPIRAVYDRVHEGVTGQVEKKQDGGATSRKLSKDKEKAFQEWYEALAKYKGLNPDPDDSGHYYDYRAFWDDNPEIANSMLAGNPDAHFTDKYKLPGHSTFSNESIYGGKELGGEWVTGGDGRSYYKPSVYTMSYIDKTMDYLKGTGEGVLLNGIYILPENIPNKMKVGGSVRKKQDYIYNRLVNEHGFAPIQAVAILANLTHESGLTDDILGDNGASYGLQQWKGQRRKNLFSFAKSKGHSKPTIDDQIDFLVHEYKNNQAFQFKNKGQNLYQEGKVNNDIFDYFQYSKADFDNAESLWDATIAWNQGVGRPNKKYAFNGRRYEIAVHLANRYGVEYGKERKYTDMGYSDMVQQEPVNTGDKKQDYYENYGKQILINVLPAQTPSTVQSVSSSETNVEKKLDEDEEYNAEQIEAMRQEQEMEKRRALVAAFLPNIQLKIKGTSKIAN